MSNKELIKEFLENKRDVLKSVVEWYQKGDTDLPSARTYYWATIDAYLHFAPTGIKMPNEFLEYGKILDLDVLDVEEVM